MQLEFLQTGDVAAPGGVTGAAPLPRDMDPLESELTLDALKDAQADLVARVESTAKDLHDSLETGGRMAHPNHLRTARYQTPARTAAPSAASAVTSAAATTASSTPPPPPPAPVPPATAPPIQLTEADLNGEQLKEARDKLDNVLDDVMGSIRPSATDTD